MAEATDYKWNFAKQAATQEDGPNNAMVQNFRKSPYPSLVREAIQNSLDVQLDKEKPVRVEFKLMRIRRQDYASFFGLEEHIKGCLSYFSNNEDAKNLFGPMLDYFNSMNQTSELQYIQVSDYNTTGMEYRDDNTNPFYSFVRSAGVSSKNTETAGGSYGFGKAAYFNMSLIRTVLVSTMTSEGKHFFEGIASLCTHTLGSDNEKYCSIGYFDNNGGTKPVSENNKIPLRFQRKEPGTDICIMGIRAKERKEKDRIFSEMIQAVLRNFWLAIYDGKLVVEVGETEIKRENIRVLMENEFTEEDDNTVKKSIYMPRPYFKAIADYGADRNCVKIEREMPELGHVVFYAYKKRGATDKIIYMREPRMYVYSKRTESAFGFYGIFLCDSERGNSILRRMENPAHDEWSHKYCSNEETKTRGKNAENELDEFIKSAIEEMFPSKLSEIQEIEGLKDFLYIPTDVEDDEESEKESLVGDVVDIKGDIGSQATTDIQGEKESGDKVSENIGQVLVDNPRNTSHSPNKGGQLHGGHGGGKPTKTKGGGTSSGKTDEGFTDDPNGIGGSTKRELPIRYRTFAYTNEGKTVHRLVIRTEEAVENAEIKILVGSEQQEQKVPISWSSQGEVFGNSLKGIRLSEGKNILDIRFPDDMKYALNISAHED